MHVSGTNYKALSGFQSIAFCAKLENLKLGAGGGGGGRREKGEGVYRAQGVSIVFHNQLKEKQGEEKEFSTLTPSGYRKTELSSHQ